jgi:hypothetical protein
VQSSTRIKQFDGSYVVILMIFSLFVSYFLHVAVLLRIFKYPLPKKTFVILGLKICVENMLFHLIWHAGMQ